MSQKQSDAQHPLAALAKAIHHGPEVGGLAVFMSRAGVGKTACLVQVGLDALIGGRRVLHISLRHSVEHAQSYYDTLFHHLAGHLDTGARHELQASIAAKRMIVALEGSHPSPQRLAESCSTLVTNADFRPDLIIINGYDFSGLSADAQRSTASALRELAAQHGARLWMAVQTHRKDTGPHPQQIPAPTDNWADLIEIAIFLEPHEGQVQIRLLKAGDAPPSDALDLELEPRSLRIIYGKERAARVPTEAFTLLSGGAEGSEAEFGTCAEKWGACERNFTFEGRTPARNENLVYLGDDELAQGAVSPLYLQAHMHRTYRDDATLRRTLQSIWHQVNTAGEVFAVGTIQPDQTVRGGTGWAVELGRLWKKPVHVYDQERRGWYGWQSHEWVEEPPPVIHARRFCGTGTRRLSPDGKAAIEELFQRSFGPCPSASS